jgi:hypothetical protein
VKRADHRGLEIEIIIELKDNNEKRLGRLRSKDRGNDSKI